MTDGQSFTKIFLVLGEGSDRNFDLIENFRQTVFCNGTARYFAFSLIIEGTTEKVLQLVMPLKSINNQSLGFIERKLYFSMLQRCSSNKKSINWHYFCHENIFLVTFSELPPMGLC
jgi:hypothetical protein